MSRPSSFALVAVVMALFLSAYVLAGGDGDEQTPKPGAAGDKELNERIAALEERVAALEDLDKRVTELERRSMTTIIRSQAGPPAADQPLPPGWKEQEFNGLRYYLVPLNEQNAPPATILAPLKKPSDGVQPVE